MSKRAGMQSNYYNQPLQALVIFNAHKVPSQNCVSRDFYIIYNCLVFANNTNPPQSGAFL